MGVGTLRIGLAGGGSVVADADANGCRDRPRGRRAVKSARGGSWSGKKGERGNNGQPEQAKQDVGRGD